MSTQQNHQVGASAAAGAAVCILSDDAATARYLRSQLLTIGSPCVIASSLTQLGNLTGHRAIDLVLLDRGLNERELEKLASDAGSSACVTFGQREKPSALLNKVESLAHYRLRHPLSRQDLENLLERVNGISGSKPARDATSHLYRGLVGNSPAMVDLRYLIEQLAPSESSVLISGETGSGKEIVARNLHYRSQHHAGSFVPVNCSAIPDDLMEAELFGYRKGAFAGALSDTEGRFALAAGGTLFLNEVANLPLESQAKLLLALEDRTICAVGSSDPVPMTARVVAATHRNIEEAIEQGRFRQDLYYRLSAIPVHVPALRERAEDIPELVAELNFWVQRQHGIGITLTDAAMDCLISCAWPANLRELANLLESLAIANPNGLADAADLPFKYLNPRGSTPAEETTV